jgi:hypothetical protein
MTTYRLYPSADGPGASTSDNSQYVMGISFKVTTPGVTLQGYWYWVADASQWAGPQDYGLWEATGPGTGSFVAGSKVTSAARSLGWNYTAYGSPVALTANQEYRAVAEINPGGAQNGYSSTAHYWDTGAGDAGIAAGPLLAYAAAGNAANPEPSGDGQMTFSTAGFDVTADYPASMFDSGNYWLDVQVAASAAAGSGALLASGP